MKLISFEVKAQSYQSYGVLTDAGIVDLGKPTGQTDIKSILQVEQLKILQQQTFNTVHYQLDEIELLPVVPTPEKILCVGMNYADKCQEFNVQNTSPTIFIRFADSQAAHKEPLIKPKIANEFDFEGEMAVIIGKTGRHIKEEDALDFVAGYSCYMDGSVRDWQNSSITAGKNWPKTGAFGPCLVTTDDIPDPHNLTIQTFLNGQTVQSDHTSNMMDKIPYLLSYISTFTELNPGDVILTGSPGGVGKKRTPPLFLKKGDVIEVEIEKIGRLSNIIDEQ
ncbi:fumarylacetoacetate hydrolase family protein [Neisseria sp. Ec49-e6-T10]|uniref:fumarylacetoacetate hydrolase family protein n=1 Tax=Neisseria sp. Ec49-e6-T10 TaxID=3140744 RepID=UPI003EB8771D